MAMFGKSNAEENGSKVKQGGNLHNHFGEGTVIQGEVRSPSNIRIDGTIKGTVQSDARIIIGANGKVEGDVICENADISGKVMGRVEVKDLLQLTRTASIQGDIVSSKLVVEAGAKFNGTCTMGESKGGAKRLNESKDGQEETYQKQAV